MEVQPKGLGIAQDAAVFAAEPKRGRDTLDTAVSAAKGLLLLNRNLETGENGQKIPYLLQPGRMYVPDSSG